MHGLRKTLDRNQLTVNSKPKIAYLTGTDANRLLNTGLLSESFKHHMPDQTLHICDFGMTDGERRLWQSKGTYLEQPDQLARGLHPWMYKASLCHFVDTTACDAVVWIDADMVLVAAVHEQIENLVEAMTATGSGVAVSRDASNLSLGQTVETFAAANHDMTPLHALVRAYHKNPDAAYMNTGFLIVRDFEFAADWSRQTRLQSPWLLFEQNTFNAIAGGRGCPVHELDAAVWNVHGDLLADVRITGNNPRCRFLHTTSAEQRHHIENKIEYPIGDLVLPGWFKMFCRDDLRDLQQTYLLKFLQNNLEQLLENELLVKP